MPPAAKLAAGTVVGRDFRIVSPIGTGGMGTVYVAEQLSTGRQRALKVMHEQWLDDDKQRERFVREAKVSAQVDSAHVVDVVAAGTEDDGTAWIAMELLQGEDLATFLPRNGPLSPGELLEMFEQLCHALAAAHAVNLVHRDIKPENVFITRPREARARPLVKVLDFGIAKLVAKVRTGSTTAIGSPAWMSPEQADPKVAITPSTDVWALGLLAFWLLTGRSYWTAASGTEFSIHAMMKEILFDARPLASSRAAELGVADRLPPGFDGWFDRCVHREPRARFVDAGVSFDALRQLLGEDAGAGEPAEPSASGDESSDVATMPMSTRAFLRSSQDVAADDLLEDELSSDRGRLDGDEQRSEDQPADVPEPLPEGRTSQPRVLDAIPPDAAKSRGLLFGGLAAALAVGVTLWWFSSAGDLAPAAPPPASESAPHASIGPSSSMAGGRSDDRPAVSAGVGGGQAAVSTVTERSHPAAGAATSKSAASSQVASLPTISATVQPGASASASGSVKPTRSFNKHSADQAIGRHMRSVRWRCKGGVGPKRWAGTVTFAPTGSVKQVTLGDIRHRHSLTGRCVQRNVGRLQIPPYDGGDESLPFSVTLP